jgi:hypothetical protein
LPGKPPLGSAAAAITTTALDARVKIDLEELSSRLLNETHRLLVDFAQQPLTNAELAEKVGAGLEALGTTVISQAGRGATAEAFNLGRNLAAQDVLKQIDEVVRVEILDSHTCPPCKKFDGKIYKMNSPEYFQDMPPNGCDGGDFCRGFFMYRAA